jgi:hypothetical protein
MSKRQDSPKRIITGWICAHCSLTAGAVIGKPSFWCGCDPTPVYGSDYSAAARDV